MKNTRRQEIGKLGEELAEQYLKTQGYKILVRNYRYKRQEIDIIAQDGPVICFVEVKTRSSDSFGLPEEAVDKTKRRKISQIVLTYIKRYQLQDRDFRFDVVSVMLTEEGKLAEVNLIKDAFCLDQHYFF